MGGEFINTSKSVDKMEAPFLFGALFSSTCAAHAFDW